MNKQNAAQSGKQSNVFYKRLDFWILLILLLTLGLFFIPGLNGWFFNAIYASYVYPLVRFCLDILFSHLPFNAFWLFILIFLVALGCAIWRNWGSSQVFLGTARWIFRTLFVHFAILVILFYWLWGFHYQRMDLVKYLGLDLKNIKELKLKEELTYTLDRMIDIRQRLGVESEIPVGSVQRNPDLDSLLNKSAALLFNELRLPFYNQFNSTPFWPKGFLLRLRTLGFYMPFTGECYYDPGVHHLQQIYIQAHEWTHAQGITDEGDANFLAYLICVQAEDQYIAYAGHMEYFRYLLSDLRKLNTELYALTYEKLPEGISAELMEIRAHIQKYPEFMPQFRDAFYNTYLVVHGVQEGTASYDRLVRMVIAYQRVKKL